MCPTLTLRHVSPAIFSMGVPEPLLPTQSTVPLKPLTVPSTMPATVPLNTCVERRGGKESNLVLLGTRKFCTAG